VRKVGERSQWEEGNVWDVGEFEEMTLGTGRERCDWGKRTVVKLEKWEVERRSEAARKERNDWKGVEVGGHWWKRRRGD
jgi:hypothetical protein